MKRQELWFDEMRQKRSNNSYQKYWKTDFRMTGKTFEKLANLVFPNLSKEDTKFRKSIPVQKRVAIALWRLSTGNSFRTIAKTFAVGKSTVVSIAKDFCKEIRQLSKEYIKFPVTSNEVENAIEKFKTCCNSKIPQSLGVIDGTHVYIKTPQCDSKYDYFCRKQRYSINTQAVVGGDLLFLDFTTGFPDSLHDSHLPRHTSFLKANGKEILAEPEKLIENLTVCPLILGDAGYPLTFWLVCPYNFTQTLPPQEKRFNKLLSSARVTVERAFGVLKARWRCLLTLLNTNLENVSDVIITCFA